jgi:hypothetical protein
MKLWDTIKRKAKAMWRYVVSFTTPNRRARRRWLAAHGLRRVFVRANMRGWWYRAIRIRTVAA